jgi:ribonuclease HI
MNNYLRTLYFYTDGNCSTKTEMGGWAAICIEDNTVIDTQSGYEPYSTNNRMKLMALLSALENINTIETSQTKVYVYTCSSYIVSCFQEKWYLNWISNGWKTADRQSVKNQDLWARIIALYIKAKSRFHLEVIKIDGVNADKKYSDYVKLLAIKKRQELEVE